MGWAEFGAYVSRGILACPLVGDREVPESSRHRMTAVFLREAQTTGHRWEGLLLCVQLASGWNLGGLGMLLHWGQGGQRGKSSLRL